MYPTPRECTGYRCNNRRWATQAPSLATVAAGRFDCRLYRAVANGVGLFVGAVVRITRIFVGLLVRLQDEVRALCRFRNPDSVIAQRDISPVSTTVRRARF